MSICILHVARKKNVITSSNTALNINHDKELPMEIILMSMITHLILQLSVCLID